MYRGDTEQLISARITPMVPGVSDSSLARRPDRLLTDSQMPSLAERQILESVLPIEIFLEANAINRITITAAHPDDPEGYHGSLIMTVDKLNQTTRKDNPIEIRVIVATGGGM